MTIPRKGRVFVIRRGKAKRKVRVEIEYIYRREPVSWARDNERMRTRYWFEVGYKTEGTWANHGRRNATLRNFMRWATPV